MPGYREPNVQGKYACEICREKFRLAYSLRVHIVKVHSKKFRTRDK